MVAGIHVYCEYERELVRERTALKLEHARKSGRKFGRPAKLNADQAAGAGMATARPCLVIVG